ncbi:MAG TPA: preprotein translocase subunit SecA [Clostridiaceae bacterium]|jgi:preprotein translocase, secA subunit|nr:preprotein translocase subunit SecA [Clostridiaceae bacterium]
MGVFKKIFKSYSEKEVKRVMPIVEQINKLEPEMEKLTDKELTGKTEYLKKQLEEGKTLDDILPEAFAVVREASKRVLGLRHFDVQLIGGIILHQGRISEMKTGEGKTLVATLPAYLNALTGKGVHVITVNDYLAKRDSEWMGKLYKFLGLSVGLVVNGLEPDQRREAYAADITYGTNNEFGFDYLRDNMVLYKEQLVQRELNYAIVDEIDSILIDEARTPLIISGRANKSSELYKKADGFVRTLDAKVIVEEDVKDYDQAEDNEKYDYIVDLKAKSASLTQKGIKKAEEYFKLENFNDLENSEIVHNVNQALRAHGVMKKDIDYIVKDGEVLIVDEFTGRIMYGRRYNNGLHQAIEAKEHVKIADESKTLATITFQNYFRMYNKLSGMTGTAMTEESEFQEIYHLDVVSIPTNKPMIRKDTSDIIYKNEKAKFRAVVQDVKESYEKGQPVLIGTVSIEKSEKLSKILTKEGIKHQVLNAKAHEREAEIIAQAGKYGAVTIATNMAGRGTDIMLGGNSEYLAKQEMKRMKYASEMIEQATAFNETEDQDIINARKKFRELVKKYDKEIEEEKQKVVEAGGLKIIGTERHESRRIDNQLRGRSGRQGDPGCSRFYIGLDDNLMKIFGGDAITKVYDKLNASEDLPIESRIITNAVENAQKRVEGRNFSIRKNVLKYDDVMNAQRELIYRQRREVLDGKDLKDNIEKMFNSIVDNVVSTHFSAVDNEKVNKEALMQDITDVFGITELESVKKENPDVVEVSEELAKVVSEKYAEKEKDFGEKEIRELERVVVLKVVDQKWMDHIDNMEELKNGIGLRAYGQKDPVVQYRIEGTDMFDEMNENIRLDVVKILSHVEKVGNVVRTSNVKVTNEGFDESAISLVEGKLSQSDKNHVQQTIVNDGPKVGRNDPCPCGSGKKYKNCCGRNQ